MRDNTVAHQDTNKAIMIQSSKVHLGDGLADYARENILRVASKDFERLNTASARFPKEGITYRCSVNMQMDGLPMKSAEARDKDIYLCFNTALGKVAKQLRRTKRELREDKGERIDKDVVLRERISPTPDVDEDLLYAEDSG
jgi:ribosomal subunit interface protein